MNTEAWEVLRAFVALGLATTLGWVGGWYARDSQRRKMTVITRSETLRFTLPYNVRVESKAVEGQLQATVWSEDERASALIFIETGEPGDGWLNETRYQVLPGNADGEWTGRDSLIDTDDWEAVNEAVRNFLVSHETVSRSEKVS